MLAVTKRNLTRELAEWAASLRYEDIPPRVIELAKYQAASTFAAAHAGLVTDAGRQALRAARKHGAPGRVPILATGETFHLDTALAVNSALGMALDYDDYLFMGHSGHSAVWVPYLLGQDRDLSTKRILTAQVIANEVAGRIGAACIFGPQNGQLWSHIHLGASALAAGVLYGLDAERLTHALGIAYAQPNYGLFPGFMGPGSKVLTAATPSLTGLWAARYAEAGMTGNPRILEDAKGFLRHFTYRSRPDMLSGLGSAWITETLAVKPYPGCAYLDTAVDVALELSEKIRGETGGSLQAEEIGAVHVEASLLTTEMNRLSKDLFDPANLSPININFNIPVNVAVALSEGELSPRVLSDRALAEKRETIVGLARRVTLSHSWTYTLELLRDLDRSLGADRFFEGLNGADIGNIVMQARRDLDHDAGDVLRSIDLLPMWKAMNRENRSFLRRVLKKGIRGLSGRGADERTRLDGVDFGRVRLPFGARVTVTLKNGSVFTGESRLPKGSAARGDIESVARDKLIRELQATCPADKAARAWNVLLNFEKRGIQTLLAAVTAPHAASIHQ